MPSKVLIIAGPTGSGKSQLALDVAESLLPKKSVIINADSLQVYEPLSILSAKPDEEACQAHEHQLYGVFDANTQATALQWGKMAAHAICKALEENKQPIVVGGTGFYIQTLMEGLSPIPDVTPDIRDQARALLEDIGAEAFYDKLISIDPKSAKLNPKDTQRTLRAWEVYHSTGKTLSTLQELPRISVFEGTALEKTPPQWIVVGLFPERAKLNSLLNARFKKMVLSGGLDEAKELFKITLPPHHTLQKAIGIPELFRHLKGEIDLNKAISLGQQSTRQYAKRQLTWFRHRLKPDITVEDTYYAQKEFILEIKSYLE